MGDVKCWTLRVLILLLSVLHIHIVGLDAAIGFCLDMEVCECVSKYTVSQFI